MLDGGGSSGGGGKGIYIDVSAMASEARGAGKMPALMRKTVLSTFKKKARSMTTSWPGKKPSKRDLRRKGLAAFHVHGTLNKLTEKKSGGATLVSCKVSMLLATYPEKSMFGFLNGGAKVQAGTSARDIRYAKEDCVVAVVEDLIGRKIIPTIKSRTP